MASEDVARVHREAIIVEGHRDMFETHDRTARRSGSGVCRREVIPMPDLRLSLALNDYVHTADIANGRVRAPGVDLTIVSLPFESVAMRFGANLEFDVAEYSLANYCAHLAEPKPSPMVALPVFTSRVFRHSSIYVNDASSIVDAGDLAGRTVGIPQWSQTATVYVRGFLTHDAGVPLRSIRWVQAGVDQPGRRDGVQSYLPEGVTVTPRPDRTLSDLLASGEIDAVISARPPQCFMQGAPGVRRLFADFRQEEERYFARTGIFPIMHVIAMRRPVYEANPWIARNLLDAFETAKRAGLARLRDIQTSHLPSAWATDEMERVHKLLFPDGDCWPYGLAPNRTTLEAFLAYAHEQGVTRRRLACEELFPKEVSFEVRIRRDHAGGALVIPGPERSEEGWRIILPARDYRFRWPRLFGAPRNEQAERYFNTRSMSTTRSSVVDLAGDTRRPHRRHPAVVADRDRLRAWLPHA